MRIVGTCVVLLASVACGNKPPSTEGRTFHVSADGIEPFAVCAHYVAPNQHTWGPQGETCADLRLDGDASYGYIVAHICGINVKVVKTAVSCHVVY